MNFKYYNRKLYEILTTKTDETDQGRAIDIAVQVFYSVADFHDFCRL